VWYIVLVGAAIDLDIYLLWSWRAKTKMFMGMIKPRGENPLLVFCCPHPKWIFVAKVSTYRHANGV